MAPTKRAAGDGAAPPPGRRLRVTVAAAAPGSSNTEPPSSLRRFLSIVLVVLFLKRPKVRSTDSVPVSLSRISRLEMELGALRRQVCGTLCTLLREQEYIKKMIRSLSSKLDNMAGSSANHHNHERMVASTNQERTNAEAEGLVANEREGKGASIRLRFHSEMKPPVYHEDEIKSISIGIYDGDAMIKSGPFSKLKVEVLALEGSFPHDSQGRWTPEEFHEHRAYGRDGKGNVLAGKGTNAQLINGECHLGSIRFREGSCRARNGMYIIGARVCDGQAVGGRVQEAVMNPVVVQDRRNKYNGKSYPPNLADEVYRLENIAINGEYRRRLNDQKIYTVEDFLKALHKDEEELAKILQIKKKRKDWDKMIKHAQECSLEGKLELKSYSCAERNVVLFFNYVHRLVGAKFDGCYVTSDKFEPAQRNLVGKLKRQAYDQLDGLNEDHILKDNIPVPIYMDRDAVAGPSCVLSATQHENSGHRFAVHQVGGTPAAEVLSPHATTEPLHANANGATSSRSSISNSHATHNGQAWGTDMLQNVPSVGDIPAVEGVRHGLNESPFEIANNGPHPSFSVSDHTTENYQDQGSRPAVLDSLGAQNSSSWTTDAIDMHLLLSHQDYESPFLQHQADTEDYVQMHLLGPGNETLEALTSGHINMASAHISMALVPQQLIDTGTPGSAQGSVQRQTQAPLSNNGTTDPGSFESQQFPPQQWS